MEGHSEHVGGDWVLLAGLVCHTGLHWCMVEQAEGVKRHWRSRVWARPLGFPFEWGSGGGGLRTQERVRWVRPVLWWLACVWTVLVAVAAVAGVADPPCFGATDGMHASDGFPSGP